MNTTKKAVLLLSGGLDSATVLEIAKSEGYQIYALTFSYEQRHAIELEAVKKILARSPVQEHKVAQIDLRAFGGSALTSSSIDVPKSDHFDSASTAVPVTYVPARNTIFLSFALAYAESVGAFDLFLGVNAVDYSNYPDCRPEYIACFEQLANLATAAGVQGKSSFKIHAPLIQLSKAEIIQKGLSLGVDYSITRSCYDPSVYRSGDGLEDGLACGKCDACHLRLQGFQANQMTDPAAYKS